MEVRVCFPPKTKVMGIQQTIFMKKFIYLSMALLLATMVFAEPTDTDLDFAVWSGGNMDAEFWLNADGDLDVTINGWNPEEDMTKIVSSSHRDDESIFNMISYSFVEKEGTTGKYYFPDYSDLHNYEARLRWSVENYMMSRVFAMYEQRIRELEYEVEALYEILKLDICNARIQKAIENDLDTISCDNETYLRQGDQFIIFKEPEKSEEEKFNEWYEEQKEEMAKRQKQKEEQQRRWNNTFTYINSICDGEWIDGKCIG